MNDTTRRLMMGAAGAGEKVYVEDVFSTYLYTGNGSTQTITNGIDLAGKGGLVWTKNRNAGGNHTLIDTVRGTNKYLMSDSTNAENSSYSNILTAFNSNGYTLGADQTVGNVNYSSAYTYASWTFRKQAKFFDVVTYTGNGSNPRSISHNLGSVPGCIIIKRTESTGDWIVYHRSTGASQVLLLNATSEASSGNNEWNGTAPTSTHFTVSGSTVNSATTGATYVAYLFAHDAGGFGDAGDQSVVSCGTFTGNSTVNLGWEPQWVLFKRTDTTGNWRILDNMRGMPVIASSTGSQQVLFPNTSGAEGTDGVAAPTPTGFTTFLGAGTYIYIAIRRGPMKTPTVGTEVFSAALGTSSTPAFSSGFPLDLVIAGYRNGNGQLSVDRVRGSGKLLTTSSTSAESSSASAAFKLDYQNGCFDGSGGSWDSTHVGWMFRRAPGFFDVVGFTGTGVARTVTHNLGVAPELMIVKNRTTNGRIWAVYSQFVGATRWLRLEGIEGQSGVDSRMWNSTAPTATVFSVGDYADINADGENMIAYLFATAPGVSKVGNYTGTGTTLSIDCGFTAGARFVLIKRTEGGAWYVWDTARGIISGNDPYLLLNSAAIEVTNTDYIDPYSAGFEISSTAPVAINANGGSFIFLAIA